MGTRRKGRELAVQLLYQWEARREAPSKILESFPGLETRSDEARDLARHLFLGTLSRLEAIDERIEGASRNWKLGRMSAVDRSILRVAAYELLYEATPSAVVINEALEITKKYSALEAVEFVNGVLDAIRVQLGTAAGALPDGR
jgi:N utilization substance protein B